MGIEGLRPDRGVATCRSSVDLVDSGRPRLAAFGRPENHDQTVAPALLAQACITAAMQTAWRHRLRVQVIRTALSGTAWAKEDEPITRPLLEQCALREAPRFIVGNYGSSR